MSNHFLKDGRECKLVTVLHNGYLVRPISVVFDGEEQIEEVEGELLIVDTVYDRPPVAKVNDEILAKKNRLEEIENSIRLAEKSLVDLEDAHEKRLCKLAKYDQLKRVEKFLDGELTHFLIVDSFKVEIVEASSFLTDSERPDYAREGAKLLALFGLEGKNLAWKVNRYYDGSGSWKEVVPFSSFQEAKESLQDRINRWETCDVYLRRRLHDSGVKYGLIIPDELSRVVFGEENKQKEKERLEITKKIEALKYDLKRLDS